MDEQITQQQPKPLLSRISLILAALLIVLSAILLYVSMKVNLRSLLAPSIPKPFADCKITKAWNPLRAPSTNIKTLRGPGDFVEIKGTLLGKIKDFSFDAKTKTATLTLVSTQTKPEPNTSHTFRIQENEAVSVSNLKKGQTILLSFVCARNGEDRKEPAFGITKVEVQSP